MSSNVDPTRVWRKRTLMSWAIALPTILAAGWWAITPPTPTTPPSPPSPSTSPHFSSSDTREFADTQDSDNDGNSENVLLAHLDLDAFDVDLWPEDNSDATDDSAPTLIADRTPPPMNFQLVGIVSEPALDGGAPIRKAALYDPDTDRILIIASGERIGEHTVSSIEAKAVVLAANNTTHTLSLRPDLDPITP